MKELMQKALVPVEEQPYVLPQNWCWVKFEYLATEIADGPFGSNLKTEHYTEKKEVRIIQLSNIGENGWRDENIKYTTYEHAKSISRSIVKSGEIVIAKMMPAGRAIIVPNDEKAYILSSDAIKFVPKKLLNTDYLLYAINSYVFRNQVSSGTQGITRARTSIGKMKMYSFPLAPLAEQNRIANRIESFFEKLDRAKELMQNALESFETRKAAILYKAFTGELTKKWREENSIELGSWYNERLGSLTNITSSRRIFANEYICEGIPFFRSTEVVELNKFGVTNPKYFISRERYNLIQKSNDLPSEGDLLVTSVGTIGETWIVDGREFYYKDGNLTLVKQCKELNTKYLKRFIDSELFKEQINDTVAGSAYNALTIVKFKNIIIPVPSIDEQLKIVEILESIFEKEESAKEFYNAIERIDLMKKAILARAFRGQLGTNDPAEESAIKLLKQIIKKEEMQTYEN